MADLHKRVDDLPDTEPVSPAYAWERDSAKRALDELFSLTFQYRSSKAYLELLRFVARFRFYSPFNAMLVNIQMPGASFVSPPYRWLRDYGRRVKPGARPLVILQPMGPVMFVFDVSDTEGKALPAEVERPFEVRGGTVGNQLGRVIENGKRDGVNVTISQLGSQQGGYIAIAERRAWTVSFRETHMPVRYELVLNQAASDESKYASLAHELAHLYCGHLGTPNPQWWPDRRGLNLQAIEFEAESVAYMVCSRAGIATPSETYLASYVGEFEQVPSISLECVMKAAGLIENMSREKMDLRRSSKSDTKP